MFKVGDKVRIIQCVWKDPRHENQIGCIIKLCRNGHYEVQVGNELTGFSCDAVKIELYEKKVIKQFGIVKFMETSNV
jgi:hypothetical protein